MSVEGGRQPKRGIRNKENYKANQEATLKSGRKTELPELNDLCILPELRHGAPVCRNQILKKMQNPAKGP